MNQKEERTGNMANTVFNTVRPLHYWTYKILPLVYDDSLSYYEVLAKATKKLNEVIANNNNMPDLIKEAIAGGGYLDNLQEQIAELNDGSSATATADRTTGQLIWLNGDLYRITRNMLAGDQYIQSSTGVTGNIEKLTFEEWCNRYRDYLKDSITDSDESYNILASKNYSSGDVLWWKDQLYTATGDIARNSVLSTDINLTSVTLWSLIKNLQSRLADDEKYPIYYPAEERMKFKGSVEGSPIITTTADTHIYNQGTETMEIKHVGSGV